jgi:hypothetical protein
MSKQRENFTAISMCERLPEPFDLEHYDKSDELLKEAYDLFREKVIYNETLRTLNKTIKVDHKLYAPDLVVNSFDHIISVKKMGMRVLSDKKLSIVPIITHFITECTNLKCENIEVIPASVKDRLVIRCAKTGLTIILAYRKRENDYLLITAYQSSRYLDDLVPGAKIKTMAGTYVER